jgi:hypothetical protein
MPQDEGHGRRVPAHYHINHEDELVSIKFAGDINLVDAYELCQSLLADPNFNPKLPQLADLREVRMNLTPGAIKPFVHYVVSTYRPRVDGPIAIVLDGAMDDDFCAGVYRFACNLNETEVFDDYALAIKWLLGSAWVSQARARPSAQPKDSGRDQADEEPKQIRA